MRYVITAQAGEDSRTPDPEAPFDVCWSEPAATDTSRSVDERCSHLAALAASVVPAPVCSAAS